jgi:hypothetical protein
MAVHGRNRAAVETTFDTHIISFLHAWGAMGFGQYYLADPRAAYSQEQACRRRHPVHRFRET